MTTTRTMTVSEANGHILGVVGIDSLTESEAKELAASLVGVTIVPDPEPRPDFASMTNAELAVWLSEHDPTSDFAGVRQRLLNRCIYVADQKGMGR